MRQLSQFRQRQARGARPIRRACLIALTFMALGACAGEPPQTTTTTPIVFVDVTVLPMTEPGARLISHTVVVRNGVITRVAPTASAPLPQGAQIIQGGGRYLLPGLADMHVTTNPAAPETPALFVGHGVTTVREMAADIGHVALNQRIQSGDVVGPTMVLTPKKLHIAAADTHNDGAARARVEVRHALGFDSVFLSADRAGEGFWAAFGAARDTNTSLFVETPRRAAVETILAAEPVSIERLSGFGDALARLQGFPLDADTQERQAWAVLSSTPINSNTRAGALARMTARQGVWNCPALSWASDASARAQRPEASMRGPPGRYVTTSRRRAWLDAAQIIAPWADTDRVGAPARADMTKTLFDAGAPVLACSRAGAPFMLPGPALHDELDALVDAGVSPKRALLAATRDPALFLGAEGDFGVVAVGARADLILVDEDPTTDLGVLRRPDGVMVRGVWFNRRALNRLMRRAAAG